MMHYTEGLIFIPEQRVASRNALVEQVLTLIGGPQQIVRQAINVSGTNTGNLSLLETLDQLYQSKGHVSFLINLGGFTTEIWFRQPNQGHYILMLEVDKYEFREIEGDPSRVEVFAAAWIRLCEALQASAAIFSNAYSDDTKLYIDTHLIPLLEHNIAKFVNGVNWRTYLEPALAQLWREQAQWKYYPLEELPSGALVLHEGRGYNPELGDEDIVLQSNFLIAYLEKHQGLPDNGRLLIRLQEQHDGPVQRYLELSKIIPKMRAPTELRNEYYTIHDALRNMLADVRAVLAYAHRLTDVVNLYQPVTLRESTGETKEIEIPLVRDQGREWVLPTLLYPFSLAAFFWRDEKEGLPVRLQPLLDAAQQHPVAGKAPRVVVFFWHGVNREVQNKLQEMGASVVVSPDPLPLLEDASADHGRI